MLKKLYYRLHKKLSRPEERDEYSSGYWQDLIRSAALKLCNAQKGNNKHQQIDVYRKATNLLEVGCGEGLFLKRLAAETSDINIYGVDIWSVILQKAKSRLEKDAVKNVFLLNAAGVALPFRDRQFDTVVSINIFFNLPSEEDVLRVLQEMIRVCAQNGRIIFDIRNSLNPFLYFKYKFAKFYDETIKNIPLKTYRLTKIIPVLERYGLNITRKIYIGSPHNMFAPVIVIEAKKGDV